MEKLEWERFLLSFKVLHCYCAESGTSWFRISCSGKCHRRIDAINNTCWTDWRTRYGKNIQHFSDRSYRALFHSDFAIRRTYKLVAESILNNLHKFSYLKIVKTMNNLFRNLTFISLTPLTMLDRRNHTRKVQTYSTWSVRYRFFQIEGYRVCT